MDDTGFTILLIISALFISGTNACVEKESTFIGCFEQFDEMEQSSVFWSSVCSDMGFTVVKCLIDTSTSCPQFWTETNLGDLTYQRDLVLSITTANNSYIIACERHTHTECEDAWNCFVTVFWNPSSPAFTGLAEFYGWLCGNEHGIASVINCFQPAEQLKVCPKTLEYLRKRTVIEYSKGDSITFEQLTERIPSECEAVGVYVTDCNADGSCVVLVDKAPKRITDCLNNNASQCQTVPTIDFGQNILKCDYTDVTELCIQNGCGHPATIFFKNVFEFLKCGKEVNSGSTCAAETRTVQVGQEGYEVNIRIDFPLSLPDTIVTKDCPSAYKGAISRTCSADGDWGPITDTCFKDFLSDIQVTLDELKNADDVDSAKFQEAVSDLTNLTEPNRAPIDKPPIEDVRNIIDDVTDVFEKKDTIRENESEGVIGLVSNAVDETTEEDWKSLIKKKKDGANTLMRDVDRVVRKIQAQGCSSEIDTDNLDVTIRSSSGDIKYVPASGTGEIFIAKEALDNKGLTGAVCYGGVHYETLSPIVSPRLEINGKLVEFGAERVINTDVISLQLRQELQNFQPPIHLMFPVLEDGLYDPECVSWDFSAGNDAGAWSTEGCTYVNMSDDGQLICLCTHLTNFAVLMSTSKTSEAHVKALSIISAVGCAISICGLILTIVFHMLVWRLVRSDRSTILMNLCVALLIALVVFLAGINRTESTEACKAIAAVLHYLFLTVFFLMLTQGIEILICVVHVFTSKFRLKLLLPFAWVIPAVIVAVSLGVTKTRGYGNSKYCWLSVDTGLIWAFVGPAALVIFINIIVVIVVFKKLVSSRAMQDKSAKDKAKTSLRGICVLLPLLGCTWAFGILSINTETVVFQYIFCILNSLQGLFIFLFHCVLNHQLRDALRKRSAKKRSLATLESDLKKRSASDHTGQDISSVSQGINSDKKSDSSSKKKHKIHHHNVNDNRHAGMNGLDEWQKEQRKQHQRNIRKKKAKNLDWTT